MTETVVPKGLRYEIADYMRTANTLAYLDGRAGIVDPNIAEAIPGSEHWNPFRMAIATGLSLLKKEGRIKLIALCDDYLDVLQPLLLEVYQTSRESGRLRTDWNLLADTLCEKIVADDLYIDIDQEGPIA